MQLQWRSASLVQYLEVARWQQGDPASGRHRRGRNFCGRARDDSRRRRKEYRSYNREAQWLEGCN